jgi:hypothetical protein
VDVDSGCLDRLRRIAFFEASDRILNQVGSFETYWKMASTSRMFFGQENTMGGFTDEATFRFQCNGSNNCYLASAATFYTLKIESDVSNAKTDPIDVAQVARHYLLRDDGALEKRVLRNEGGHPFDFVYDITGLMAGSKKANWNYMDFSGVMIDPKPLGTEVIERCNKNGPGLILDFCITEHFREAANVKIPVWGTGDLMGSVLIVKVNLYQ